MFSLLNKIAVVTGGGSGIGRSICLLFAKQGAQVHLLDINREQGAAVVSEIETAGGHAHLHVCNVVNQQEVQQVFHTLGAIQILVNNAGIAHIGNAGNTSEQDFDKLIAVNVKGVYNCIKSALPGLAKGGGGVIINMASIAAVVGLADRFAYSAAKGAVMAMTMSVAKDYLRENIRCNSVSPARVHTPFVDGFLSRNYPGKEEEMFEKLSKTQPIGRMAEPEEVASMVLYLCSDEASFLTGCDYPVDGGFIKLNG